MPDQEAGRRAAREAVRTRRRAARRRSAAVAAVAVAVTGSVVAGVALLRPGGSGTVTTTAAGPAPAPSAPTGPSAPSPATGPSAPAASAAAPAGSPAPTAASTAATGDPAAGPSAPTGGPGGDPATPRLRGGGPPFPTRCPVTATLVPTCGAYWGIYSRRFGGGDVAISVRTWERTVGRRFDIVLMYYDFSGRTGPGRFPDDAMTDLGRDRLLLFDWESRDFRTGEHFRWADIAAGRFDAAVVVPQARRIKAYGRPVMLGLDHEMDLSAARHGTAAEYKAAYRHLREVFAAEGVDNVVWTWVTSGYVGYGNGPKVKSFYPGDAYVDWIGYDPYNFAGCHDSGWETFDETVKGFYEWSAKNGLGGKPLLLQEYGTTWGGQARTAQWYRDIDDVLRARPRIKALVRWDSDTSCTLRIDAGDGAVDAFAAAGLAVGRP